MLDHKVEEQCHGAPTTYTLEMCDEGLEMIGPKPWYLTLILLFAALIIGQATKHLCMLVNVPYTPILTLIGLGLGQI